MHILIFLKKSLAMTNSLSVSTSFSSCIILRSILTFGYQTKIVWPAPSISLLCLNEIGLATINTDPDAYPRWIILIGAASSYQGLY